MSAPIQSAPLGIRDHAEDEMALSVAELCVLPGKDGVPTKNAPPCQCFVKIGLFFDGTNNNRLRDEPLRCHTNIAKLFKAHKSVDEQGRLNSPGHYKIYIPGLGTRFPENSEWRESQDGKAMGKGGQARILYALLEVYNSVHRVFNEDARMLDETDIAAKLQQYTREVESNDPLRDRHTPRPDRRSWFDKLSKELDANLRRARVLRPAPDIPKITLNIFGFSRGAAQARAFCYWFDDLLAKDGTFAGMPAEINFLGLFDSVASVGLANSAGETTPVFWADGHWGWAGEILKPLPRCVKQTVHYVAAHEQRRNFPLTRVKGGDVREYLYPGVHSDVGGGYAPGDQGRSPEGTGMLLSQVPLLHMHKAARVAGVPLLAYCVMPSDLRDDYDINPTLSLSWNWYMDAWREKFDAKKNTDAEQTATTPKEIVGDYHSMVRAHMQLYYDFRRTWLHDLPSLPSFERASAQDREDLASYNRLLIGDLALLQQRVAFARQGGVDVYGRSGIGLDGKERRSANLWQVMQAENSGSMPDKEQLWALQQFEVQPDLPFDTPFLALLGSQVHDSLAGFYLAGYVTNEEKAEALLAMEQAGEASAPYKKRVWQNYQDAVKADPELSRVVAAKIDLLKQAENTSGYQMDRAMAKESARQQTAFTPEEQTALAKLFPLQTDADAAELRHSLIRTQTETRREGSGYLRQRHVF
jgi:hypothetical protein